MIEGEEGGVCPFCGQEEYWEPCEHMVLDWTVDNPGDGGGIESGWSQTRARQSFPELADALKRLFEFVLAEGDEDLREARLSKLKAAMGPDAAPWWSELLEWLWDWDQMPDDPTLEQDFTARLAYFIVEEVPSVIRSSEIIGGMTSADHVFVWSEKPGAAVAAIEAQVSKTAAVIQAKTSELSNAP